MQAILKFPKEILEELIKRGIAIIDENSSSCAELVKKYFGVYDEIANECDKEKRESKIIKREKVRVVGMTKYRENIFNCLKENFGRIRYKGDKINLEMNEIDRKEFIKKINEIYAKLNENHRNSLQYSTQ